jgi:hypothetical protein
MPTQTPPANRRAPNSGRGGPPPTPTSAPQAPPGQSQRDPGVTDSAWAELQADKRKEEQARHRREKLIRNLEKDMRATARKKLEDEAMATAVADKKTELENQLRAMARKKLQDEAMAAALAAKKAEADEARRRWEELQRQERERERERARMQALMERERQKGEEEARVQTKLRNMGVCVQGYPWIKQGGGYRCGGGSHFIPESALR